MRLVAVAAGLVLATFSYSLAHDIGDGLQPWYEAQVIPRGPGAGQSCCSQTDMVTAEEDIRDGHYWTKFCAPTRCTDWMQVPDDVVLYGPNRNPIAVVWYGYRPGVSSPNELYIRCFSPGSGV